MNITKIDIIIIIVYFISLVLLGFFRKPRATISQRDYIIHGRKLSLPGFVISLVSTWYGAILESEKIHTYTEFRLGLFSGYLIIFLQ